VTTDEYPFAVATWLNESRTTLGKAARTVSRRLSSAREFGYAFDLPKIIPNYNLPTPEIARPHPLPGLHSDIKALIDLCDTRERKCLVALLGYQGMRLHEALGATVPNFDIENKSIRIRGKGDVMRVIPLFPHAAEYIIPQLIHTQLDRPGGNLIQYSDRGARRFITMTGMKAGISRPISSHDLRATFATLTYNNCRDIMIVKELLGHSDPSTTAMYIGKTLDDLRKAGEF
jgi:integrase